ncbi:MAG: hypothetical protein V7752_05300 [Halopseudomonas sp.]
MALQSLHHLVERVAGKDDTPLIVSALERFEIQTEIGLTETTAIQAIHRAVDYIENELAMLSSQDHSLSQQQQLIAEHLQRAGSAVQA